MALKNLMPILLLLFLVGCVSTEKLLHRGNYDQVIDRSIKKILKKPGSSYDIEMLDKAYNLANQRDLERVNYLKMENNPRNWNQVMDLYNRLKNRQSKVQKVLPMNLHGRVINYDFIDYDREIVEAKQKAADFYYNNGKALMQQNTKEGYRQAYTDFNRVRNLGGNFPDIDLLIQEARYLGLSRVLITSINNSHLRLPPDFTENLKALGIQGLNSEWVEFHLRPIGDDTDFDYFIDINLLIVDIPRPLNNESDRVYKKTIEDGFSYALDRRGNVMKDSLGNDIKIIKYKDIICTIIEKTQEKHVSLRGEVELISSHPRRLMAKDPVSATTSFRHVSARAIGDINALDPEARRLLDSREMPFPDDLNMIYDTAEFLKRAIHDVIRRNRHLIR